MLSYLSALTMVVFSSGGLMAQEVWFSWLDNVPRIQSEWTETQEDAFSIWNNITRFQDFEGYEKRIDRVLAAIDGMQRQHDKDKTTYSKMYPRFFELSWEYIESMRKVVYQLKEVLKRLKEKSKNVDVYSWGQYQKDLQLYNELLRAYRAIGHHMNEEFARIQ